MEKKELATITVQFLVQLPGRFLCVIYNLVTKTKFETLRTFLKIFQKRFFFKIHMDSKKSINSFKIKKNSSLDYFLFFWQFF